MLARTELDVEGQILLKAADLLEESKWFRGKPSGEYPFLFREGLCLFLAIWNAKCGDSNAKERAANRAMRYLGFTSREQGTVWNDHPDRTKEQVVDVLRSAAYYME